MRRMIEVAVHHQMIGVEPRRMSKREIDVARRAGRTVAGRLEALSARAACEVGLRIRARAIHPFFSDAFAPVRVAVNGLSFCQRPRCRYDETQNRQHTGYTQSHTDLPPHHCATLAQS